MWDAQRNLTDPERSNNPQSSADKRFAAIKAALPAQGVVGYIGEPGALALGDYYAAQYALAPLVVDHSPNHSLVVGNFSSSSSRPASLESQSLYLISDFGGGVLLFADKAPASKGAD